MKIEIIVTCILFVMLAACAPLATPVPAGIRAKSPTKVAISTPMPTVREKPSVCAQADTVVSDNLADYVEPDPETWVMMMRPVREYFYYRKKAVVAGNVKILWLRYPALAQDADFSKGLNAEAFFIENMKALKPVDGNISPEFYERIKVRLSGGQAEVIVHEMELYLYVDDVGRFEDSGGEFKIILFLCSQRNQQWTVYKTHDISGP